jgi:hypothetical protein
MNSSFQILYNQQPFLVQSYIAKAVVEMLSDKTQLSMYWVTGNCLKYCRVHEQANQKDVFVTAPCVIALTCATDRG